MNKGIASAEGEIIGILNSDDFYSSNDILFDVINNIKDVDAVYGDIHYVASDDLTKTVRYYSSKNFKRGKMIMGYMPAHPSFYCKARVYKLYGAFDKDFRVSADFEQLFRLIYINGLHTKYIAKDFVTMRIGGASTNGLKSHIQILKDHYKTYKKHNVSYAIIPDLIRYPLKLLTVLKYRIMNS